MKRLLVIVVVALTLASCSRGDGGQLTGVPNRPAWFDIDPFGMAYIPQGSFVMGENDQDVPHANLALSRTVSVAAFYIDDSEITNNEYRQFVHWVQDSIARTYMLEVDEEEYGITLDAYGEDLDEPRIAWDYEIPWGDENEDIRDALEPMYYSESDRFYGKKHIDITKLRYYYSWVDYKEAAKRGRQRHYSQDDYQYSRADFIKEDEVDVYPDTLCWIADFSYSYNEPLTNMYFWHPAYDNYPVVGVTWKQAKAFSHWRTRYFNNALDMAGLPLVQDFRLPTESEWEYAARGGLNMARYPWGGPYIRNDAGCFLANFKPLRGNYVDDGGLTTVNVYSYSPNDYGLFNMSGNVAEWTNNAYSEAAYEFAHDMNQDYEYDAQDDEQPVYKRKVIRGGSWKDVSYYLGVGTRSYEYQDTCKSYIGFRNVMSYLGREKGDEL